MSRSRSFRPPMATSSSLWRLSNSSPSASRVSWFGVSSTSQSCHSLLPSSSPRSEEHTPAPQSLMRISYAVLCLQNKQHNTKHENNEETYQKRAKCNKYHKQQQHRLTITDSE